MKYLFANLSGNLAAMACVGGAIYLAANQREGWGWFLFVAVLTAGNYSFKEGK